MSSTDHERPAARNSVLRRLAWLLVALAALLTLPGLATTPSGGIDPSWELGLHMARDRGLVVGRDVVFNYGPWGFLNFPLTLNHSQWLAAVVFRLVVQLALFAGLGVWMQRRLGRWRALLATVPLLLFIPSPEYRLLLALVLWVGIAIETRKERWAWAAALGGVAAATVMIKFSMGLAAMLILAGGAAAAWGVGRRRTALTFVGTFVAGVMACGLVALGSLEALGGFLTASMEISTGYEAALERQGPLWQPLVVLGGFLLVMLGLVRDRAVLEGRVLTLALPTVGLLLITFKHAFIRHETHAFLAFGVGAVALSWIALETAGRGDRINDGLRATGALGVVAGALFVIQPTGLLYLPSNLGNNLARARVAQQTMREPSHRSRLRETLRRQLPLHEKARTLIGGHTVDVLTIEVALAEAWDLNWKPRRVLQSYAVGTSKLDEMDARFFAGSSAPERLLVDLQGLDTRHPFMDAPRTWREILARYDPLGREQRWMVLGRRERPRDVVERSIQSVTLPMNHVARVPQPEAGHLEMRVRLVPSLLGKLVSLPWKLPEIRLGLVSSDAPPPRRILARTSDNPFPLTRQWPDTPEDLWNLYADPDPPPPPGLALFTQGSWAWNDAVVEFYQVEWQDPAWPGS